MTNLYIFLIPKLFSHNLIRKNDRNHGFTFNYPGCPANYYTNSAIDCAICLNEYSKVIGRQENCDPYYLSKCLIYWSNSKKVCPF